VAMMRQYRRILRRPVQRPTYGSEKDRERQGMESLHSSPPRPSESVARRKLGRALRPTAREADCFRRAPIRAFSVPERNFPGQKSTLRGGGDLAAHGNIV
jgi:hypothetical protein